MFPIITKEKQKVFEEYCIVNKIGNDEKECNVPCICGYYGRACRNMDNKANSVLCMHCGLASFVEKQWVRERNGGN